MLLRSIDVRGHRERRPRARLLEHSVHAQRNPTDVSATGGLREVIMAVSKRKRATAFVTLLAV
jgi:hypothetical protein